jgi:hypothetical protein
LSYRDLVAMMGERGIDLAHTTILRWVQQRTHRTTISWSKCRPLKSSSIGTNPGIDLSSQNQSRGLHQSPPFKASIRMDIDSDVTNSHFERIWLFNAVFRPRQSRKFCFD